MPREFFFDTDASSLPHGYPATRGGNSRRVRARTKGAQLTEQAQAALERIVGQRVVASQPARWGFTNRTDVVTLPSGARLIVQRYRRREDAAYRLRVTSALAADAELGALVPRALRSDLDGEPPWAIFEPLPGVPVPEAGVAALNGARFPLVARQMGELLVRLRRVATHGLGLKELWAHPEQLARAAGGWLDDLPHISPPERAALTRLIEGFPALFAGRRALLAHGDFAPVNVLVSGSELSGLLDFEAARLADPLFDVAWWHWVVKFHHPDVLERAWPALLAGAELDESQPELARRVHALQTLRLLELLSDVNAVSADTRLIFRDALRAQAAAVPGA